MTISEDNKLDIKKNGLIVLAIIAAMIIVAPALVWLWLAAIVGIGIVMSGMSVYNEKFGMAAVTISLMIFCGTTVISIIYLIAKMLN